MKVKTVIKTGIVIIFAVLLGLLPFRSVKPVYADGHVDANHEPQQNQRVLPIIMYHQILKNRKSDYIVTPGLFENDLIEMKERGYETVFPSEVIAFCEGRGGLPQKPVMLTFDDGHYNNIYYGMEALKKHGCKAVLNIIGVCSDNTVVSGDHSNPAYSHLTWEQIGQAADSGVYEIGNHTFDLHNQSPRKGVSQKKGESEEQYRKVLTDDVMKLQSCLELKSGVLPECFAYPFGKYSNLSEKIILEMNFKMIFVCYEQQNMITAGVPSGLYRLCRFNRLPNISSGSFFDKMEKSKIKEYIKTETGV